MGISLRNSHFYPVEKIQSDSNFPSFLVFHFHNDVDHCMEHRHFTCEAVVV